MKKYLLTTITVFSCLLVFGQTEEQKSSITENYDQDKLNELIVSLQEEYERNYARALELAKINGWELRIVQEDSSIWELQGVTDDGQPIYFSTLNEGAARTTRTDRLYPDGDLGLNLTGEGMMVGLWEINAARATHELFEGRLVQIDASGWGNHANHVAGTIIGGDGVQFGAQGMAYEANIRSRTANNDESEMAIEASNGMLISNHSYGIPATSVSGWYRGKYDGNARDIDAVMYNAPYYLAVLAAGNDRNDGINSTGYDILTDKACNKNGMTVAAVNQVIIYNGPQNVGMSSFSSWGPTDDGRIKPDISAKGVNTRSASAESNTDYYTASGTSMAAPNVAGTLILLQQHYFNVNEEFMLSSTVRGLSCHTALAAGENDGPDYEFGWGLLNAEAAAEAISDNGGRSLISEITLNDGESYTIQLYGSEAEQFQASITWTDPQGTVGPNITNDRTPVLVNDLDLRVLRDTNTYLPWILDVENPSAGASRGDNLVDNIEKVEVDSSSGLYTIVVTHKGTLSGPQVFSLIVTGIGDCAGTLAGTAYIDSCGTCVGGTTGLTECVVDCNGDFDGTAFIDSCGYCADGNTGFTPILNDEICKNHESGQTSDLLEVFPNPANGELNIHFTDSIPENTELHIYTADGKLLYELINPTDTEMTLDVSGVESGVYLIRLTSQDINIVERIVIAN